MPEFEDVERDNEGDPLLPHYSSCGVVLVCKGEDKAHESAASAATREQAALLRECARLITATVPLLRHEFVCPEAAVSFSDEILDVLKRARALLSKLPASEQEKKA